MAKRKFTNNATSKLASGIGTGDTVLTVTTGEGSKFPSPTSGDFCLVTLEQGSTIEIVRLTSRSTDSLTVARAQESTSAASFTAGATVEVRVTAQAMEEINNVGLGQITRGLHLRTHPDNDVVGTKLWFTADEIVMDDGERVPSWGPIVIDSATTGVNGRDSGSMVNSTHYRVFAIKNKKTGAKAGLIQRAKDWTANQSLTSTSTYWELRLGATTRIKLAQSFQLNVTAAVPFVDVALLRSGSPVGNVWFTIEADSSGAPSGTPLATSDKLNANTFTTTNPPNETRVIFRSPATLTTSTTYWLVLQGDYSTSSSNNIDWRVNQANGYASGKARGYDGTTWADINGGSDDFYFKIFVEQNNVASPTMPTDYDQIAQIGWTYRDSGGNFIPFKATDRDVEIKSNAGMLVTNALTATIQTLYSLAAFIPPIPVRVRGAYTNGTTGNFVAAGGVPEGWQTSATFGLGGSTYAHATSGHYLRHNDVDTDFQGIYLRVSGGTGEYYITGYKW